MRTISVLLAAVAVFTIHCGLEDAAPTDDAPTRQDEGLRPLTLTSIDAVTTVLPMPDGTVLTTTALVAPETMFVNAEVPAAPENGLEIEQLDCPKWRATVAELDRTLARYAAIATARGCAAQVGTPGYDTAPRAPTAACGAYVSAEDAANELSCAEIDEQRAKLNAVRTAYAKALGGPTCWKPDRPLPKKREDVKLGPSCGNPANDPEPNYNCTQADLIAGKCFECRPVAAAALSSMSCTSPILAGAGIASQTSGDVQCRRVDTSCVTAGKTNGEAECTVSDTKLESRETHLGLMLFTPGVPVGAGLSVAGMGGAGYSWTTTVDFKASIKGSNGKGWEPSCKVGDTLSTSPESKYTCDVSAYSGKTESANAHVDLGGSGGAFAIVDTSACVASRRLPLPQAQACYAMSAVDDLCRDFAARVRPELTDEVKRCIENKLKSVPLIDSGKSGCFPVVWDTNGNLIPNGGDLVCNGGKPGNKRCVYITESVTDGFASRYPKGTYQCVGAPAIMGSYSADDGIPAGSIGKRCYAVDLGIVTTTRPDPYACAPGLVCAANPKYSTTLDYTTYFESDPPYVCARDDARFAADTCSTVAGTGRSAADVAMMLKALLDVFPALDSATNGQHDGLVGVSDLEIVCARGPEPAKSAACFVRSSQLMNMLDIADQNAAGHHDGLMSRSDFHSMLAYVIKCGGLGMEAVVEAVPPEATLTGQMIKSHHDESHCLTHDGEGNDVFVARCDPKNPNQRFVLPSSGDEIEIKPASNTGLCLDLHPTEKVQNNGYRGYMHPCHGGDNQKWKLVDGQILQEYTRNDYCLDWWPGNGGVVHVPKCHSSALFGGGTQPNQKWTVYTP